MFVKFVILTENFVQHNLTVWTTCACHDYVILFRAPF